jgi:hypothetical protein
MSKRDREKLETLAEIAALLSYRAQRPMAQAQARAAGARIRAQEIGEARAQLGSDATDPVQAAFMARQAIHLRQLHGKAMSDVARFQAELEIATAQARPQLGRKIAIERLLRQSRR